MSQLYTYTETFIILLVACLKEGEMPQRVFQNFFASNRDVKVNGWFLLLQHGASMDAGQLSNTVSDNYNILLLKGSTLMDIYRVPHTACYVT